jgi:UDP-N-acetylglucosamine transferase subunit ALG13
MNNEDLSPAIKILVAPLDWGLGHATRCIPIIRHLTSLNCKVFLAGDGRIKPLLTTEFPSLTFLDLPGYNIRYSGGKWKMPLKIAQQIPGILQSIKLEHEWLQKAALDYGIDGIISDNRYGLYHSTLPTVFITHQLRIQTSLGSFLTDILQELNYSYINKFSFCWVPDNPGTDNLAGKLSHPREWPEIPVKFLGPLSRMKKTDPSNNNILIILSGPEPQRTQLENLLLVEASRSNKKIILVRGLPGQTIEKQFPSSLEVYNHLTSSELEKKIGDAAYIISRCGYSTVMDLAIMNKKSILIPTPGQTEQEYLARHLMENNYALCINQEKFRLQQAIDLAENFRYQPMPSSNHDLTCQAIKEFTGTIIKQKNK